MCAKAFISVFFPPALQILSASIAISTELLFHLRGTLGSSVSLGSKRLGVPIDFSIYCVMVVSKAWNELRETHQFLDLITKPSKHLTYLPFNDPHLGLVRFGLTHQTL